MALPPGSSCIFAISAWDSHGPSRKQANAAQVKNYKHNEKYTMNMRRNVDLFSHTQPLQYRLHSRMQIQTWSSNTKRHPFTYKIVVQTSSSPQKVSNSATRGDRGSALKAAASWTRDKASRRCKFNVVTLM